MKHQDEIYASAVELTNSGDIHLLETALSHSEQCRLKNCIHNLIWASTDQSLNLARGEAQELLHHAATRIAEIRHFISKQPRIEEFA